MKWKSTLSYLYKVLTVCLLLFIIIITGLYALFNVLDWKNSVFNPPEESQSLNFELFYPPPTASMVSINANQPSVALQITLSYNGTMIEGQPVKMSVVGSTSLSKEQLSCISVGFEGAMPYAPNMIVWGTPNFGVSLSPSQKPLSLAFGLGTDLSGEDSLLVWQVQGDYCPSIVIHYNSFDKEPIAYQYESYNLHISSADSIRQERYNRINSVLTVALFIFAFIESFALIGRLWQRKSVFVEPPNNASGNYENPATHNQRQAKNPRKSWNYRFRRHGKKNS